MAEADSWLSRLSLQSLSSAILQRFALSAHPPFHLFGFGSQDTASLTGRLENYPCTIAHPWPMPAKSSGTDEGSNAPGDWAESP